MLARKEIILTHFTFPAHSIKQNSQIGISTSLTTYLYEGKQQRSRNGWVIYNTGTKWSNTALLIFTTFLCNIFLMSKRCFNQCALLGIMGIHIEIDSRIFASIVRVGIYNIKLFSDNVQYRRTDVHPLFTCVRQNWIQMLTQWIWLKIIYDHVYCVMWYNNTRDSNWNVLFPFLDVLEPSAAFCLCSPTMPNSCPQLLM